MVEAGYPGMARPGQMGLVRSVGCVAGYRRRSVAGDQPVLERRVLPVVGAHDGARQRRHDVGISSGHVVGGEPIPRDQPVIGLPFIAETKGRVPRRTPCGA